MSNFQAGASFLSQEWKMADNLGQLRTGIRVDSWANVSNFFGALSP